MRILITGATGFIGSEVLLRLLDAGVAPESIFVLSRRVLKDSELLCLRMSEHGRNASELSRLNVISASLDKPDELLESLDRLSKLKGPPWRVVHLAALISTGHNKALKNLSVAEQKATQNRVNLDSTKVILEWANAHAELFVFTSSVVAFGGSRTAQIRSEKDFENFPKECREIGYFYSKRQAHEAVLDLARIPTKIFCPGIVHGSLENFKPSRGHLKLLRAGKLEWAPPGGGSFVGLDRVSSSIVSAILGPVDFSGCETRLLVDENMSYRDYFNLYLSLYRGTETKVVRRVPQAFVRVVLLAVKVLPFSSKIKSQLSETLGQAQYFLWFKSDYPLASTRGVRAAIQDSFSSLKS